MALRNDKRTNAASPASFLLVLIMAFAGWWYATSAWQFSLDDVQALTPEQEGDWIDFVATLGEDAIQIFINLTGDSNPLGVPPGIPVRLWLGLMAPVMNSTLGQSLRFYSDWLPDICSFSCRTLHFNPSG
ncbi:MAG: hypothetical protein R2854_06025 [Caldilineaceae bacterium]